jgi:hypothetical protein
LEINVRHPDLCAAIQVQYRETYPSFRLSADRDLSPFYTKSSDWQYEDEYRLIAEEEDRAFSDRTLKTRNQFYKLPSGSLISIIIGVHAPDETRRTIRSIVDRSGKNLSRPCTPWPPLEYRRALRMLSKAIGWADVGAPFGLIALGPYWRPRRTIDGAEGTPPAA